MNTLSNVKTRRGEENPLSVGLAPDAFPEAQSSKTGVSVRYVPDPDKSWFVFRASYGREDRASDYIVEDGTYTYIAKKYVEKYVGGIRKRFLQPLIPNLLFVYTTPDQATAYIKNTPPISFLSYYYNHFEKNEEHQNPPLIIPPKEMEAFMRATCSHNQHMLFVSPDKVRFRSGETVRIVEGAFKGAEGKVARISGQQRVVVSLAQLGYVTTAYIPSAFLQKLDP